MDRSTATFDLEALSLLAKAEGGALAAVARREGLTPEDAVDCVQEGLCTLLDLARTGQLAAGPADWGNVLVVIVRNAARNRRRRHFRARPHEDIDDRDHSQPGAPPIDELLARAERHVKLQACVAELCEIQRAVVIMRMLEERDGEDVAAALGISRNYVGVLLHRAKESLRTCMSELPES